VSYQALSRALDAEILSAIATWRRSGAPVDDRDFGDLALRLFAYQLQYNQPYARYCAGFGVSQSALPSSWRAIPPVPAAAFKEATLATFDPARAALAFETSGTTQGTGGRHYMETRALYDAALLAAFDRFMLPDGLRLRYLNVVPNPSERPESSLGYMMAQVANQRGDGLTGWYVRGADLLIEALFKDLKAAADDGQPVCIATTTFALAQLLDAMVERNLCLALPNGSRIMETGGFKGRTRVVDRDSLSALACERFALPDDRVVAEYGMTELTSQYYDDVLIARNGAKRSPAMRRKVAPPWLQARVVGPDGLDLPHGTVGTLVHVDLANRSSCVAIATEDLGAQFDDGLVVIGRETGAALRGCSLDAEELRRRS
jgi:hypothetical protein